MTVSDSIDQYVDHPDASSPSILMLAIGEAHQLFHILKVAIEIHAAGADVSLLVSTQWHAEIIERYCPQLSDKVRRAALFYHRAPIHKAPPRLPNLILSLPGIVKADAVITPERTSSVLRWLPRPFRPMLVHVPHGAGDRARSYDPRIRHFDLVLSLGEKDRERFIQRGLSRRENTYVIGYGKLDLFQDLVPEFFAQKRPVILYNPHFDEKLSSWLSHGEPLVKWFFEQDSYNVIIAPHLRIGGRSRILLDRLAARYAAPHLRFDGGSLHSVNMDYTRIADIYLGDVSSQVYEFLHAPKPCVFINAHGADWRNSNDFAHWAFGRVASTVDDVISALLEARDQHADYVARQMQGVEASVGSRRGGGDSPSAAELVLKHLPA